jgi:ACR3 family arsenite efflux pump ArsB
MFLKPNQRPNEKNLRVMFNQFNQTAIQPGTNKSENCYFKSLILTLIIYLYIPLYLNELKKYGVVVKVQKNHTKNKDKSTIFPIS